MALVIGLERGETVFIGKGETEIKVTITDIMGPTRFKIFVETPSMDYRYEISGDYTVSVGTKIVIGCGTGGTARKARVLIQAPRHIEIERGKWRDKQKENGNEKA